MAILKKFVDSLTKSPIQKQLEQAKDVYELERMLKQYSYVHNLKGWM